MRAPGSSFLREQVVVNDGPKASAARFMQGVDTRAHHLPTYLLRLQDRGTIFTPDVESVV